MKAVSGKEKCRILERNGWELFKTSGSHHKYGKIGNPAILIIPIHGNKPLRIGILSKILKDAGLWGKV
jgi:predicted RNA binding protein YcfA (HicA-like mRNA interferase family)